MTLLAPTLQGFFTDRLIGQRHASPHTITAYRDTLRMLLAFAAQHTTTPPSLLDIDDLDAPLIGRVPRPSRARTREHRPDPQHQASRPIRSLFKYAALKHPEHAATIQRVLAIPSKRFDQALVTFLTDPELDALLDAPDRSTWIGRRDHALILLAAQTGLRVSELTSLTCSDIRLGTGAHVNCLGKGRKQRITPLTKQTVAVLNAGRANARESPTTRCSPPSPVRALSRDALEHRLAKHGRHRHHDLPIAQGENDLTPRAPPHRGDASAASRRRHHRDRSLARP